MAKRVLVRIVLVSFCPQYLNSSGNRTCPRTPHLVDLGVVSYLPMSFNSSGVGDNWNTLLHC